MSERYPDDSILLSLAEDAFTGVEYIPTGSSPYFLEFRKLIHRTLLAAGRANDMRVYQDGDLTIGVRPGRCFIQNVTLNYGGVTGIAIVSNSTTYAWLDSAGVLQLSSAGFPADRTGFVPLAEIVTGVAGIDSITDLRSEAYLNVPGLTSMGIAATATEINQAVAGIGVTVDVDALNRLTTGPGSTADSEHRHLQVFQDQDSESFFTLINNNSGVNTNAALVVSLPNKLPNDTLLLPNLDNGFLSQRYGGTTYNLVGSVHAQLALGGSFVSTQTGKLMGVVPIDGTVSRVILSLGTNIVSTVATDGVSASVKINGVAVTSTDPAIQSVDGSGFKSTAQGVGTAAVVKSDGTEQVQQGDVFTVDLIRNVSGTVTVEAADVVVLVAIRAKQPE